MISSADGVSAELVERGDCSGLVDAKCEMQRAVVAQAIDHIGDNRGLAHARRSEEHTSELQSLMRISYAVFCLKKKKTDTKNSANQPLSLHRTHDHNTHDLRQMIRTLSSSTTCTLN